MKKIIILLGFVLFNSFVWHKYYVSVTEINIKENKLEIIIRTFPDDIQNVLADTYHIKADLDREETYKYVKLYFLDHFILQIDGRDVFYNFSGFTQEDGFFIVLLEADLPEKFSKIRVKNTILQDMFDEQKNIIHFLYGNKKTSFILTKNNLIAEFNKT